VLLSNNKIGSHNINMQSTENLMEPNIVTVSFAATRTGATQPSPSKETNMRASVNLVPKHSLHSCYAAVSFHCFLFPTTLALISYPSSSSNSRKTELQKSCLSALSASLQDTKDFWRFARKSQQGRVVWKLVNADPGLKVNWTITEFFLV